MPETPSGLARSWGSIPFYSMGKVPIASWLVSRERKTNPRIADVNVPASMFVRPRASG